MRMYAECREMVGVHQPFGLPAATLGCCAVIDFTLSASRASRYRHAARHLAEYSSLAPHIDDYGGAPDHAAYLRALRAAHPRKAAFWQEVNFTCLTLRTAPARCGRVKDDGPSRLGRMEQIGVRCRCGPRSRQAFLRGSAPLY